MRVNCKRRADSFENNEFVDSNLRTAGSGMHCICTVEPYLNNYCTNKENKNTFEVPTPHFGFAERLKNAIGGLFPGLDFPHTKSPYKIPSGRAAGAYAKRVSKINLPTQFLSLGDVPHIPVTARSSWTI